MLAAAIAAGAALWLNHLANSPDSDALAYVLTTAICTGAVTYLVGTLLGHGDLALRLRWIGWIVMTVPLLVPSTFSLALPVVASLAMTLDLGSSTRAAEHDAADTGRGEAAEP